MGGVWRAVSWPFRFEGRIGRAAFAAGFLGVYLVQVLLPLALLWPLEPRVDDDIQRDLWLLSVRTFGDYQALDPLSQILILSLIILGDWALVALAFRRAATTRLSGWSAAFAFVPTLQVACFLVLLVAPAREALAVPPARISGARTSLQGAMAGVVLSVLSVTLGALVFGSYGYVMFVATPFLVGLVTAMLANRRGEIGPGRTTALVTAALALAGLALIGLALEGLVCIVMAFPLAWIFAYIGSLLGRRMGGRAPARGAMMSVAILPALFAAEKAAPDVALFHSRDSVIVEASPAETWRAVIHMTPLHEQPSALFRLGIAYPWKGEIVGEGVGAIRRGYFSTGVATERVTEWRPGQRLAFTVTSDAPTLKELSPWEHVNAPHVDGYFRTIDAAFDLEPLPGGRTRLTLSANHALNLQPALYWGPLARWAVTENKRRVLTHIARQAAADHSRYSNSTR